MRIIVINRNFTNFFTSFILLLLFLRLFCCCCCRKIPITLGLRSIHIPYNLNDVLSINLLEFCKTRDTFF